MDTDLKTSLWQQFGAAIDMLADAINLNGLYFCDDHEPDILAWLAQVAEA